MKVYIGCFDKKSSIDKSGYYSIQLGAANNKNKICKIRDNLGKNISKKNFTYCELSGLYWIWKNTKDDIVGLVHYRRFFYKKIFTTKNNILSSNDAKLILNKYDLILPEEELFLKTTVYEQYKQVHDINDLDLCKIIINEQCPEYNDAFNKVINSNHMHALNMFIGKKEIIDQYCEWLFPILEELEKRIDISKKDKYNQRVCGFLGERLFNDFIEKNNIKYITLPVYNIEQSMIRQIVRHSIKRIIKGVVKK